MSYKNVIIVGARGKLGDPLVRALLASTEPRFRVTALVRSSSTFTAPSTADPAAAQESAGEPQPNQLDIIKVDFTRSSDLVRAFTGQDVAIFTMTANPQLAATSKILIDAAIEAGVQRIIPSEFGSDDHPLLAGIFNQKALVNAQLEAAAKEEKTSFTIIRNGPWFDYTFTLGLGFDLATKTATIYNGGNNKFETTTMDSVIAAILAVLSNPGPSANKVLHIHDFFTSQREILAVVERVMGEKFEVVEKNAEELGERSLNALKRGEFSQENILGLVKGSVLGETSAARWDENDDSAALGLGGKTLEGEIRKLAKLVE